MYKKLETTIQELKQGFDKIPSDRKERLSKVADFIKKELGEKGNVKLNFICTHNSRRSHLAQIWTQTAAVRFNIDGVKTYSGGTEATAFNPRAVAAVEQAGFKVKNPGGENPKYQIRFDDESEPMTCFSKTFDTPANPSKDFAAIMTCSDADENCPFVPGTKFRASITYRDPKESDGTDQEKEVYDERCRQIGTEMFYMMSLV
ncbi:MAG: protein-tyrosine-phosphatase [Balneolaceae bacterium]